MKDCSNDKANFEHGNIITETCDPITGLRFKMILFNDDTFIYAHAISGKVYEGKITAEGVCFPFDAFYDDVITPADAAKDLNVSKQRISQAVYEGLLKAGVIGDSMFISAQSVEEYKAQDRKPGRKPNAKRYRHF